MKYKVVMFVNDLLPEEDEVETEEKQIKEIRSSIIDTLSELDLEVN